MEIIVGEDDFGIFAEVESYDDFDLLEDILIEKYSIDPIGIKHETKAKGLGYKFWVCKSLDKRKFIEVIDQIQKSY
ncbi:hypothetical protein [Saccharophagus degradans]|uniref:hypothetical protein n=1 Tax=Saccharophagus degradans TaxID=86304 RepID=UPI00003C924E|nr:hypothetical protein [Saccharophagus degradans]